MFSNVSELKLAVGSQDIIKRISAKAFGSFIEDSGEDMHSALSTGDVLSDLKSNIAELEDVSMRLRFMMREVSYLVTKN